MPSGPLSRLRLLSRLRRPEVEFAEAALSGNPDLPWSAPAALPGSRSSGRSHRASSQSAFGARLYREPAGRGASRLWGCSNPPLVRYERRRISRRPPPSR